MVCKKRAVECRVAEVQEDMDEVFLGAVELEASSKPWKAKITMQISYDGP